MVFRKHNSTAGFSLIEVLVAITILGFVAVPIGSSLVRAFELNARSEQMLQAQLAVSSAVETIMAEGYDPSKNYDSDFDGFSIDVTGNPYQYKDANDVTVTSAAYRITVSAEVPVEDSPNTSRSILSVTTFARPKGGNG